MAANNLGIPDISIDYPAFFADELLIRKKERCRINTGRIFAGRGKSKVSQKAQKNEQSVTTHFKAP